MTFTTRIKEEMAIIDANPIEAMSELAAFIRYDAKFTNKVITITLDNALVAKRIFKFIKGIYGVDIKLTVRNQKRFKIEQLFILEVKERYKFILSSLNIEENNKLILPREYMIDTVEEKQAFIRGLFLACGSITDPKNGTYHMEFFIKTRRDAEYVKKLLNEYNAGAKVLRRKSHQMVYVKSAEVIGEFIKMFGAVNSLFYYEDIRIYRDHKNMVNRLNNCELANQEKIIKTGSKQIDDIAFLEDNDIFDLLDERTKMVMSYRKKYPESSFQELAEIISMETEKSISKSGVNHAFIRIRDLIKKHQLNKN